jgi:hypothetical protein
MRLPYREEGEGIGFWKFVSLVVGLAVVWFGADYGYNRYQNKHDPDRIHAIEAIYDMGAARRNIFDYNLERHIKRVDDALAAGKFTLQQIGCSRAKYDALWKKYYEGQSREAFIALKRETTNAGFYWYYHEPEILIFLYESAARKLNYDIDRPLLEKMKKECYLVRARAALRDFRGSRAVTELRDAAKNGSFELSEVPVTEQELALLVKKEKDEEKAEQELVKKADKKRVRNREEICPPARYYPRYPHNPYSCHECRSFRHRNYGSHGYGYGRLFPND